MQHKWQISVLQDYGEIAPGGKKSPTKIKSNCFAEKMYMYVCVIYFIIIIIIFSLFLFSSKHKGSCLVNQKNVYIPISVVIDTAWSFLDSGVKNHQGGSDQKRPDKPQQLNSVKTVLFFFLCVGSFLWFRILLIFDGIKMKHGSWLGEQFLIYCSCP